MSIYISFYFKTISNGWNNFPHINEEQYNATTIKRNINEEMTSIKNNAPLKKDKNIFGLR